MFGAGILEGCSHCKDAWRQQHAETSLIKRACWTLKVGSLGRVSERCRLKGELKATCRSTCGPRPSDLDIFSISDFQLSCIRQRCKFQRLPSRPMIAELFEEHIVSHKCEARVWTSRSMSRLARKTWTPSFDTVGFNGLGVRCHKRQIIRLVSSSSVLGTVCSLIYFGRIFQCSGEYLLKSTLLMLLHTVLTSPHHILECVTFRLSRQMCLHELLLRMTACHGRKSIKHMVICQGLSPVVNCPAGGQTASGFAVPDHQTFAFDANNDDKSSMPQSERTAGSDVRTQRGASDLNASNGGSHECASSTLDLGDSGNLYPTGIGLLALLHVTTFPTLWARSRGDDPRLGCFCKKPTGSSRRGSPSALLHLEPGSARPPLPRAILVLIVQKPHQGGLLAVARVRATCETFGDPCASPVSDDLAPAVSEGHKDIFVGAHPRDRARQVWRNS